MTLVVSCWNETDLTLLRTDYFVAVFDHGQRIAGVPFEIAEMCLSHKAGPVFEAYQLSDMLQQRRDIMEQWAQYISTGTCRTE